MSNSMSRLGIDSENGWETQRNWMFHTTTYCRCPVQNSGIGQKDDQRQPSWHQKTLPAFGQLLSLDIYVQKHFWTDWNEKKHMNHPSSPEPLLVSHRLPSSFSLKEYWRKQWLHTRIAYGAKGWSLWENRKYSSAAPCNLACKTYILSWWRI